MKKILIIILSFIALDSSGQTYPSETLKICGGINKDTIFTIHDFDSYPTMTIKDIPITDHNGEIKFVANGLKGILLKNLLANIKLEVKKPKELNECYFVFIASDNYKVVFSWNEIFNTEIGDNLFLVTQLNNKEISKCEERILLISTKDLITGRRYIKGLDRIIIKRAE